MFHGLARLGRLHPKSKLESAGVQVVRDVYYGGEKNSSSSSNNTGNDSGNSTGNNSRPKGRKSTAENKCRMLDIYRPIVMPEDTLPVVLHIHGGGFRMLSKDSHWLMGLQFARAGYVVFNISYRLAPEFPFPMGLSDCADALEFVVKNAADYGGDTSRLILAGESAGGNLSCALAIAMCYQRPEAFAKKVYDLGVSPKVLIPFCPILQVTDIGRFVRKRKQHPWVRAALRDTSFDYIGDRLPEDVALADPILRLEEGQPPDRPFPAVFAASGTKDPLLDDTRRLGTALTALKVEHLVRFYPGEVHAFHAFIWRQAAKDCWQDALAFTKKILSRS